MSKMKSRKQNYSTLFSLTSLSIKENDVHTIRKILLKEIKPGWFERNIYQLYPRFNIPAFENNRLIWIIDTKSLSEILKKLWVGVVEKNVIKSKVRERERNQCISGTMSPST